MKDEAERGVIRLNDKTTHGGHVTTASDDFKVLGVPVALEGDKTWCPKCQGTFAITPKDSTRMHHDKAVAYDGDPTECGAKLISSVSS
ncbi:PAAR domain-containing protein [Paraburkholderia flava]|uniref:PAAR domain-containing protein n=1 Tax=Paraburkholderia flava TaxID=2547393 RepID=UPI00105CEEE6|nr:PAAR domain-containing protein [Paraburkholderia flava]